MDEYMNIYIYIPAHTHRDIHIFTAMYLGITTVYIKLTEVYK